MFCRESPSIAVDAHGDNASPYEGTQHVVMMFGPAKLQTGWRKKRQLPTGGAAAIIPKASAPCRPGEQPGPWKGGEPTARGVSGRILCSGGLVTGGPTGHRKGWKHHAEGL
ncbi:hypothetical protein Cadr_000028402 [Camelus dromedarius]|uniref:Uncharacterized protein n=1 Tax=Camelus dromedarius TaxID=9838 RepID=A0A5N4CHV0_CAMDR|nr:hypothetical protein Cadr_000028402 [Camelus dromedarius]